MLDRKKSPAIHDIPFINAPEVETTILSNGIKTILLNSGDEAVTRITMSWEGGSHEAENIAAATILTQTFKDCSQSVGPQEMADLLDFNGAWVVTELHSHHMSLNLFTINHTLHEVLPAIIDAINAPLFADNVVTATRAQIAAARLQSEKRVSFQAKLLEDKVIYGLGHPASRVMTAENLLAVDKRDLISLYDSMYRRQAPVVYIAGRVDPDTLRIIYSSLEKIEVNRNGESRIKIEPFHPGVPGIKWIEMRDSLQSAIRISIPTIKRADSDYETVRLVTTALGGYFGSRLMSVIREEKGLTYGISASLLGHHEGSYITITSQCDNRYTEEVVTETLKEITRLASEPMSDDELTSLKRFASSTLASSFDTPFSAMDYYISHRHSNTPADYLERQQLAIKRLTPELITNIAAKFIDSAPKYISIAGKKGKNIE